VIQAVRCIPCRTVDIRNVRSSILTECSQFTGLINFERFAIVRYRFLCRKLSSPPSPPEKEPLGPRSVSTDPCFPFSSSHGPAYLDVLGQGGRPSPFSTPSFPFQTRTSSYTPPPFFSFEAYLRFSTLFAFFHRSTQHLFFRPAIPSQDPFFYEPCEFVSHFWLSAG